MKDEIIRELNDYFNRYFARNFTKNHNKQIEVEFYPYNTTLVKAFPRDEHYIIRFNNALKDVPLEILKAGGRLVLHKVARKRPLPTDKIIFHQFTIDLKLSGSRKSGMKYNSSAGKFFDLKAILYKIAEDMVAESDLPDIVWSARPVKSYYAQYRKDLNLIVVNAVMDNKRTPDYVMEYLIRHELLHMIYPARYISNRLVKHTREFKTAERKYSDYVKSRKWLQKEVKRIISDAK